MILFLAGLCLVAVSIALHVGVGLIPPEVQQFAKLVFIIAGITVLFNKKQATNATQPRFKDALVGFSVLISIGIAGVVFNEFIAPWMKSENQYDEIYLFLLWGALVVSLMPLWGYFLYRIKLISENDADGFQTWRVKESKLK